MIIISLFDFNLGFAFPIVQGMVLRLLLDLHERIQQYWSVGDKGIDFQPVGCAHDDEETNPDNVFFDVTGTIHLIHEEYDQH